MRKDKEAHKAYMRDYMLRRYHARREKLVEVLGGKCCDCGTTETLELDHDDRALKSFNLAKALSGWSDARVAEEADKCTLRCTQCHSRKSITERGMTPAVGTHGTLSSYRYCKCDECRRAKSESNKKYRKG